MARTKKADATKELSVADLLRGQGSYWLTEDEKEEMSEDKTAFIISAIKATNDKKYGKRWELTVDIDGDERGLTIPQHKARDTQITALAGYIKTNGAVGPIRLKVKPFGEDGHTWLSLHAVKK